MRYWDKSTVQKIRRGYYSAVYFNRTKYILQQEKNYRVATMQIFQKEDDSVLCGVNEVKELFKIGVGYFEKRKWVSKWREIEIKSLKDGDKINNLETVMHITGPYVYFAHLESVYLGILARRTLIATNTQKVVKAAKGKPVVFFADRFDHFLNQEGDGYAAHVGGVSGVSTEAHAAWINKSPGGTIPHALIALNSGDAMKATQQFARHIKRANVVALIDFNNDCVRGSLEVSRVLGKRLWGVRLDTAENVIDKSIVGNKKVKDKYGVNPTLVRNVRNALDKNGFTHVKIVVSGGFNEKKITWFGKEKAPVDVYGVGSSLVHGSNDFTADIVKVDGKKIAKVGRRYKENKRLRSII